MNDLKGQVGVLTATVTIKRKATGVIEAYALTSEPISQAQAEAIIANQAKENDDVRDT
jgi:hypothetical protein